MPRNEECYENEGKQRNTDNLIACMKNPKVYFVSHPDDDHTPLDYERLVKAAKKYHVALEPLIVNSDAHDPGWVGQFELACGLLKELEVDDALILNNDVEKVKRFFDIL